MAGGRSRLGLKTFPGGASSSSPVTSRQWIRPGVDEWTMALVRLGDPASVFQCNRFPRFAARSSNVSESRVPRIARMARAQFAHSADPAPRYAASPAERAVLSVPIAGLFVW